mmetsp:Transcript_4890/g.5969  ORF Transcript_4890/g.5969 Transcript_4890/m.5969 type:complete len:213 (+) Transcript_4890:103-741(+)
MARRSSRLTLTPGTSAPTFFTSRAPLVSAGLSPAQTPISTPTTWFSRRTPSTPFATGSSSSPSSSPTSFSSPVSLTEASTCPTLPGRSTRTTCRPSSTPIFLRSTSAAPWSATARPTGATMCGLPSPRPSPTSRSLSRAFSKTGRSRAVLPSSTMCAPPRRPTSARPWLSAWASSLASSTGTISTAKTTTCPLSTVAARPSSTVRCAPTSAA